MLRANIRLRKGQVAMEFLILVGIAFFAFVSIVVIMFLNTEHLRDEEDYDMLVGLSVSVQNEFNSASVVRDGYSRNFVLPQTINGMSYTISKENDTVYFSSDSKEVSISVPEFSGVLTKGANSINKTGGVIYIMQ